MSIEKKEIREQSYMHESRSSSIKLPATKKAKLYKQTNCFTETEYS
jgi:hypothetical protein